MSLPLIVSTQEGIPYYQNSLLQATKTSLKYFFTCLFERGEVVWG
jgi:hypothetical protein